MFTARFKSVTRFLLAHKIVSIIGFIVLILLIVILRPKNQTPLETITVKEGTITQSITASGTVDSESAVNLNFISSGKLTYLGAKKGEEVKAGQVIATLDQRSIEKSMQGSLLDYSKQRNTFEQTKTDKNVNDINSAPSDTIKRILQNNQYDLDKAVVSVELQDLAKQSSVLTTPISGVLIRSDVTTPGVNISPTAIFTVADPDSLIFKVDVDESDVGKVHLNQPLHITLDAYPDETISAAVSSIDYASHTTSTGGNAYTVQATLPVSNIDRFRIGMNGDAEVVLIEKRNVITVPLSAIADDTYVYVQGPKIFEKRKVSLGIQSDTDVEVKGGLKKGEKVALSPSDVEKRQHINKPQTEEN